MNVIYGTPQLAVSYDGSRALLTANVSSVNYFGLRHGLETLFQLVEYDDVAGSYVILNDIRISDRPEFPHRGVILDTGRNFVELDTIQRLIDAMSMTKVCPMCTMYKVTHQVGRTSLIDIVVLGG